MINKLISLSLKKQVYYTAARHWPFCVGSVVSYAKSYWCHSRPVRQPGNRIYRMV